MGNHEEHMENISEINTVQDLLKANEEKTPTEEILKAVFDEEPLVGLQVAKSILSALAEYHVTVVNKKIEEEDNENIVGWVQDATILNKVVEMIEEVDL